MFEFCLAKPMAHLWGDRGSIKLTARTVLNTLLMVCTTNFYSVTSHVDFLL